MHHIKFRAALIALLLALISMAYGVGAAPVYATTGSGSVSTPPGDTKAAKVANPNTGSNISCSEIKSQLEGMGSNNPFSYWPYDTLYQFKIDQAPPTTWTTYTNISSAPVSNPFIKVKRTDNKIEWNSNFGIDFVIVKGGSKGNNIYIYYPSGNNGSLLTTPTGQGISHVTFCWDKPATIKVDKKTKPDSFDNVEFKFELTYPAYLKGVSGYKSTFKLSDNGGIKEFGDLPKGSYVLKEVLTKAEDSQWRTSVYCSVTRNGQTSQVINSTEEETIYLDNVKSKDLIFCTFTNEQPTRSIKFIKKAYPSGTRLKNWEIVATNTSTTPPTVYPSVKTDSNGEAIISGLPFGTYTFCEVMQNGWVAHSPSTGCYTYTIDANTPGTSAETADDTISTTGGSHSGGSSIKTFTFENKQVLGKLKVTKVVDWSGVTPNTAKEFEICITGPSFPVKNCKKADYDGGDLYWNDLIIGNYTVTESDPGGNWSVTGSNVTVEVKKDQTTKHTITNKHKTGKIKVTKVVDWSGVTPDQTKTFEICVIGPSPSTAKSCKTIGFNGGELEWTNLAPGNYTVVETTPSGYWDVTGSNVVVEVKKDQTTKHTITNKHQTGKIKITKKVYWNGVPKDGGKTFEICIVGPAPSTAESCKTIGSDGGDLTWENLIPGTYTVKENNPGNNWIVIGSNVNVEVQKGKTATAEIENKHKTGSLKVTKVVDWNGVTPDQTKTFEICVIGPSPSTAQSCQNAGYNGQELIWNNLIPGTYTVVETDPGSEWKVTPQNQNINVEYNSTATATVTNVHKTPGIEITKYTYGGNQKVDLGADANNPNGDDVPRIGVGEDVVWYYVVKNTGELSFYIDDVKVTDNRQNVPADDSVVPQFEDELTGNGDLNLDPGEEWLYKATGKALELKSGESYTVDGCKTEDGFFRPTYQNVGTVTIEEAGLTDSDLSHYCNRFEPGISIKKYTRGGNQTTDLGADADDPNGDDVPRIVPGQTVEWFYVVKNTGDVPLRAITVTDDQGVQVTYVEGDENGNGWLDLTETWIFKGEGIAEAGLYANIGYVRGTPPEGPDVTDDDPSHYIGTEPEKASLGDYVWLDLDRDGIQDDNESPVQGVKVDLMDACTGTVITTQFTNASGKYLFANLTPGTYVVRFTLPTGYVFTTPNVGGDAAKDSDANTQTGCTPEIALEAGENDMTWDAGIYQPEGEPQLASLGNYVWYDTNMNGLQDQDELPVANVTVQLLAVCGGEALLTTETDPSGFYLFSNLQPGTYYVRFILPNGYVFTTPNQGDNPDGDSDANMENGCTPEITLEAGEHDMTWDAGIYQLAAIGDYVWYDKNVNGVQEDDESPAAGVTVELVSVCDAENVLATVVTGEDGKYLFDNLLPGTYYVRFILPKDSGGFTIIIKEGDPSLNSDADPASGCAGPIELSPGERDMTWDAGIIPPTDITALAELGDFVWYDRNKNGLQDDDEPGVPGVKVDLYTATGEFVKSTTTDSKGFYLFTDLEPGSYYVEFATVPGYSFTSYNVNGNTQDTIDSDPLVPNVEVNITTGGNSGKLGEPLSYTFTYANMDSNMAASFTISTTIPAGTTFMPSESDAGWSCSGDSAGSVCTLTVNHLAANASDSAILTVLLSTEKGAISVAGIDLIATVTNGNLARTEVVTLAPGESNRTLDAGIVVLQASLTTGTPSDPTGLPGDGQPNLRAHIFLPTLHN